MVIAGVPVALAFIATVLVALDSEDMHVYFALIMFAVVQMLGAVVSYLHRIMYGEDHEDSRER